MDINASAIRFYDKKGLLPFVKRDEAGRRKFEQQDMNFLEVIDCLKKVACQSKISSTVEAGTEKIHFVPGQNLVAPDTKDKYQAELKKVDDVHDLIDFNL
jgi:DNA-binding transcriptional MerR regulator